jgi:hypothetical protein
MKDKTLFIGEKNSHILSGLLRFARNDETGLLRFARNDETGLLRFARNDKIIKFLE